MVFEKIKYYLEGWAWVIGQMPLKMEIGFMCSVLGLLALFYMSFISPIIFNYFLIPKIEKKIRKKLQYDELYNYIFLSKWMVPQSEISLYIVRRYLALKFQGDHSLPKKRNRFALKKAGYTIDMASRAEIVMSFLWLINAIVFLVGGIIILFITGKFSIFYHPGN